MNRDLRRDPAWQIVWLLGVTRLLCGLLLPFCGAFGWWALASCVFVLGFLTDMLDGELARFWRVTSKSGERLDSSADAVLTAGGLLAVTLGGAWPAWLTLSLIAAGAFVLYWLEPRWHGDRLTALIVLVPTANLTLIALLTAQLIALAGGSFGVVLSIEFGVALVLAILKRYRIVDYLRMAFNRGKEE